jgi:serine/threonine protein phosphatase PrpC
MFSKPIGEKGSKRAFCPELVTSTLINESFVSETCFREAAVSKVSIREAAVSETGFREDLKSEIAAKTAEEPVMIGRCVSDGPVFQKSLKKWLNDRNVSALNCRFTHPGYSVLISKPTEDRSYSLIIRAKNGKYVEFVAVFDGHGGSFKVSELAAKLSAEIILACGLKDDSRESILKLLKHVDRILIPACLEESAANGGCGSTGNITAITEDKRVYNLNRGDSRVEFYNALTGEILFSSTDEDVSHYLSIHGRPPPGARISRCGKYFECEQTNKGLMMYNSYGDVNCRFIDYSIPIEITEYQLPLYINIVMISTTDGLYEIYKVQFILNRVTNELQKSGPFHGFVEERQKEISNLIMRLFREEKIGTLAECLIEDQIQHTRTLYAAHLITHPEDVRECIEAELSVEGLGVSFEKQFDNHDGWVKIILPTIEVGARSVSI